MSAEQELQDLYQEVILDHNRRPRNYRVIGGAHIFLVLLAAIGSIGQERADLMLAGCAIFCAISAHWPSAELRVADRGLREGMLRELMLEDSP